MNRALLTQALAFLQGTADDPASHAFKARIDGHADTAITAIEAALAAPQPFPRAWLHADGTRAVPDEQREAWLSAGELALCSDYSIPLFSYPPTAPTALPGDAWMGDMGQPPPACRVDHCSIGDSHAPLVVLILQPPGRQPVQRVPRGMQLVPVTMTRDMLAAWYQAPAGHANSDDEVRAGYRAILEAALGDKDLDPDQ